MNFLIELIFNCVPLLLGFIAVLKGIIKMSQASEPKGVLKFMKFIKNWMLGDCKAGSGGGRSSSFEHLYGVQGVVC